MTLNLMLTSKEAVYLSGDFRLTSIKDQAPLPDSYDTQKLIPVIRRSWAALVGYMGVARAPTLVNDVGQWIVEQMDSIPLDGNPSELSRRLLRFNPLLARIRGDRRIAFSVVGFSNQRSFMMLISNFLNFEGPVDVAPELQGYIRKSKEPEVRAVGTVRPDVFERVKLERLLQAGASPRLLPQVTRQAIAEINASVARRSRGSISEACVTGYLLRSGSAAIGAHGVPDEAPCLPSWVRKDLDRGGVMGFEPVASEDGKTLPIQWKSTIAKIFDGTLVRMHEITNAGQPILHSTRPRAPSNEKPTSRLLDALNEQKGRTADGRKSHFMVLPGTDGGMCIIKSSIDQSRN